MKITLLLVISILVNIWFGFSIVRLEKFHYSTQVGTCSERTIDSGNNPIRIYNEKTMYGCLIKVQPRTSDWWNLLYGLKVL